MINLTTFFVENNRKTIPMDVSLVGKDYRDAAKDVINYLNSFDLDKIDLAFISELIIRYLTRSIVHEVPFSADIDYICSVITSQFDNIDDIQLPNNKEELEERCQDINGILYVTFQTIFEIFIHPLYYFPIPYCSICHKSYELFPVLIPKLIVDSLNWQTTGDFIVGRFCHIIVFYDINNTIEFYRLSDNPTFIAYPPESLDIIKKNDRYAYRVPMIGVIPIPEDGDLFPELLKTDEFSRFRQHGTVLDRARQVINPDNYRYSSDNIFLTFSDLSSLQTPLYLRRQSEVEYAYICPYCQTYHTELEGDACSYCHKKIVPELYLDS